jgi:hypothetical protein
MTAPGLYALIEARSHYPAPPIPSHPRDRIREWLILEDAAKHPAEFDALLIGDVAIAPIDSLSRMKDHTPVRPPPTRYREPWKRRGVIFSAGASNRENPS